MKNIYVVLDNGIRYYFDEKTFSYEYYHFTNDKNTNWDDEVFVELVELNTRETNNCKLITFENFLSIVSQ